VKLVRYTLLFWLPLYLHDELGYSAPQAGMAATLFDIGAVGGTVRPAGTPHPPPRGESPPSSQVVSGFWADQVAAKELAIVPLCLAAAPLCLALAFGVGGPQAAAPLMFLIGPPRLATRHACVCA
jgi:sugar phosphate permease